MNRRAAWILTSALWLSAMVSPCSAIADYSLGHTERLCKEEDLIGGTWKLVQMDEVPPRREFGWFRDVPYHYLAFYSDHYYSFAATPEERMTPDQVSTLLKWPIKEQASLRYTLNATGVLNLYAGKVMLYSYRCVAVLQNHDKYVKNDLILNGYTSRKKTQVYKLYRRWF